MTSMYLNSEHFWTSTKNVISPIDVVFMVVVSHFCSDLGNAALSGQLVPQLGELTNLQYL